mmetsp:Transcript_25876/g.58561  ORF Transcript_25876/g.58561 Transcript_25876/m.58561 type:complete len:99 (+) Transcript_25876:260-556(+)
MDPRDERMTMRKNNEEVHRRKQKLEAQVICADLTKAFGECARAQGMMVVFSCRKENAAMSACMDNNCTEEKFVEFLQRQGVDPKSLQAKKKGFSLRDK